MFTMLPCLEFLYLRSAALPTSDTADLLLLITALQNYESV